MMAFTKEKQWKWFLNCDQEIRSSSNNWQSVHLFHDILDTPIFFLQHFLWIWYLHWITVVLLKQHFLFREIRHPWQQINANTPLYWGRIIFRPQFLLYCEKTQHLSCALLSCNQCFRQYVIYDTLRNAYDHFRYLLIFSVVVILIGEPLLLSREIKHSV